MKGRGTRARTAWRNVRRNDQHRRELHGILDGARKIDVAAMNRIKGAAENADSPVHRSRDDVATGSIGDRVPCSCAVSRWRASARHAASNSSETPAPVTPEIRKKGSPSFDARRSSAF